MVVVGIMLILVVAGATRLQFAKDARRAREAARMINVYLGSARNRAMESGRPCGVIFRVYREVGTGNAVSGSCSMNADLCEEPPAYCGAFENSVAGVAGTSATGASVTFYSSNTATSPESLTDSTVQLGDLMQLNGQGPLYAITSVLNSSGSVNTTNYLMSVFSVGVTLANTATSVQPSLPWTNDGTMRVPFRIFPAPVHTSTEPLQLPAGTVIDLYWSGIGSSGYLGNGYPGMDFAIFFSPNGAVDRVFIGPRSYPVSDTIYLLIGKRERASNTPTIVTSPTSANESSWLNFQDIENALWLTINPQTGLVNSEPVGAAGTGSGVVNGIPTTVEASRGLAAQGLGKGGQ